MLRATRNDGSVIHCSKTFASESHGQPWLDTALARLGLNARTVELIATSDAPEGAIAWEEFAPQPKRRPEPPEKTMAEQLLYGNENNRGARSNAYPILFGLEPGLHLHFGPYPSQRTGWCVCDERGEPFPLSFGYHKTGAIIGFAECLDLPGAFANREAVRKRWWPWFRRRGFSLRKFKLTEVK
jgi:hypothetical protein